MPGSISSKHVQLAPDSAAKDAIACKSLALVRSIVQWDQLCGSVLCWGEMDREILEECLQLWAWHRKGTKAVRTEASVMIVCARKHSGLLLRVQGATLTLHRVDGLEREQDRCSEGSSWSLEALTPARAETLSSPVSCADRPWWDDDPQLEMPPPVLQRAQREDEPPRSAGISRSHRRPVASGLIALVEEAVAAVLPWQCQ
eukprot:NODE_3248_length_1015_cov_28.458592_g2986_i0.p1 GENE.NODE_3248_length_1015_cov_28.458592_g2986_i0~~NODE_3248_length_1015_cov_28.458592_g2986_i0.p1  ORF type:complete len:201 (-),score=35.55 NODE_3248_length_1015_cov_28.458592_g2986_i0:48-650(-)